MNIPEKIAYHVVYEPESSGGYTVTVPKISGCITYGETFEEASANIREAIVVCIEDMLDRGETIPTDAHAPIVSSVELTPADIHA